MTGHGVDGQAALLDGQRRVREKALLEPVDVGERAGGRFVREQERDELFQQGIIGVSSSTVAKRKIVLSRAMLTVVMVVSVNGKCTAALTA